MYTDSGNGIRSQMISQIIESRKKLADQLNSTQEALKKRKYALQALEDSCQQQQEYWNDQPEIVAKLESIQLTHLISQIDEELEKLSKLSARFSANTLNIGVVGRMGQGKSTLLQSLSGLSDEVIPARAGGACTAARSKICHRPGNQTDAVVTYHTEDSFFQDVILPYFNELSDLLNQKPRNLNQFQKLKLKPLASSRISNATHQTIYKRLYDDYYLNFGTYRVLLGKQPSAIPAEEIKDYVAQERAHSRLKDSKHLAVRQVEIYCTFPKSDDVGQISLVDLPGLGDFKLGDERLMLETLGQEVDVVLFVRKPDEDRYAWQTEDTHLYDLASQALENLPSRSFMVLNNKVDSRNGGNLAGCQELREQIDRGQVKINVVDSIIANCSDSQQANQVLDRVIDYLQTKITALDLEYAKACQKRLFKIQTEMNQQLKKATAIFEPERLDDDWLPLFLSLFNPLKEELSLALVKKRKEYDKKSEQEDDEFKQQVAAVIQGCQENPGIIPSIEEIDAKEAELDGYKAAYNYYLPKIRENLQNQFSPLDQALKLSLEKKKAEIAEILIKTGRLGRLTEVRGYGFLNFIADRLPTQLMPNKESKLKSGFEHIASFSHEGEVRVLDSIQKQLEILKSDKSQFVWPEEPEAQNVHDFLNALSRKAIHNCENALQPLLNAPNKTAFAMIQKFEALVLRAEGVGDEWRVFLAKERMNIWDEFAQQHQRQQQKKEWLEESVEPAISTNQLQNIQFLDP